MSYAYTQENRLEFPHRYMYTPFEGLAFIDAFFENRQRYLSQYIGGQELSSQSLCQSYQGLALVSGGGDSLDKFNLDVPVGTQNLLDAIVRTHIAGEEGSERKKWLDRLVQRFEVSKKIYATYLPGFRKGEGAVDNLRLYWLLGIALYLQYEKRGGLKYLSTALKVTDLLCSLPLRQVSEELSGREIVILIQAEVRLVKELIRKKIDGLSV